MLLQVNLAAAGEPGLFFQHVSLAEGEDFAKSLVERAAAAESDEEKCELACMSKCFNEWTNARETLRTAYKAYPANRRIAELYCWHLTTIGEKTEAEPILKELLANAPNNAEYQMLHARLDPSDRNIEQLKVLAQTDPYARLTLAKIYYKQSDYVNTIAVAKPLTDGGGAGPYLEPSLAYQLHASALGHLGSAQAGPAELIALWKRAYEIDSTEEQNCRYYWLTLFRTREYAESLATAEAWWSVGRTEEAALAIIRSSEKVEGAATALVRLEKLELPVTSETELMEAYLLVGLKRYQESREIYMRQARQARSATALLGYVTAVVSDPQATEVQIEEAAKISEKFLELGKVKSVEHAKVCLTALLRGRHSEKVDGYIKDLEIAGVLTEKAAASLRELARRINVARLPDSK
jgi:hypothetical protein